tara:strand:+ start:13466 stop:14464 length:999 start_codon:yes stop_codon:yes gene_type:complete
MKDDSSPYFSVIVPLFNKERFVERTLRGVLAQRDEDFEVIVVDDGSTDDGAAKVRSIKDSRIKLIAQSNQGVAAARNKGMSLALGQWLAFLDADDLWGRDHLTELRRLINTYPEAGMVGGASREVIEGGDVAFLGDAVPGPFHRINYFNEAAREIGVMNASSVAVKREVFEALGGFADFKYGEDLEYWARVALDYPLAKSSRPTAVYYRGNGGAMENMLINTGSSVPLPRSLSDISPSVAMLASRLDDLSRQSKIRLSVIEYINSRLVQGMRGAFIRGDMPRMKALHALCIRPLVGWRQRCWWVLSALPSPVLSRISRIRDVFKRYYHKLKR